MAHACPCSSPRLLCPNSSPRRSLHAFRACSPLLRMFQEMNGCTHCWSTQCVVAPSSCGRCMHRMLACTGCLLACTGCRRPRPGEKQYNYDALRRLAAQAGKPFVSLWDASRRELVLSLLPVFRCGTAWHTMIMIVMATAHASRHALATMHALLSCAYNGPTRRLSLCPGMQARKGIGGGLGRCMDCTLICLRQVSHALGRSPYVTKLPVTS